MYAWKLVCGLREAKVATPGCCCCCCRCHCRCRCRRRCRCRCHCHCRLLRYVVVFVMSPALASVFSASLRFASDCWGYFSSGHVGRSPAHGPTCCACVARGPVKAHLAEQRPRPVISLGGHPSCRAQGCAGAQASPSTGRLHRSSRWRSPEHASGASQRLPRFLPAGSSVTCA